MVHTEAVATTDGGSHCLPAGWQPHLHCGRAHLMPYRALLTDQIRRSHPYRPPTGLGLPDLPVEGPVIAV
jgi:hypothetical protein